MSVRTGVRVSMSSAILLPLFLLRLGLGTAGVGLRDRTFLAVRGPAADGPARRPDLVRARGGPGALARQRQPGQRGGSGGWALVDPTIGVAGQHPLGLLPRADARP